MKTPGAVSDFKLYLAQRARWRRVKRPAALPPIGGAIRRVGLWAGGAAVLLCLLSFAAEWAVRSLWVASPWNGVVLAVPQILLVPAFLMLVLCLDHIVAPEHRTWGNFAVAFALLYAVLFPLVSILFAVSLIDSDSEIGGPHAVLADDSFVLVLERLGRAYLCISATFAGLAFRGSGLQSALRGLGIASGVVAIALLAACLGYPTGLVSGWVVVVSLFALAATRLFQTLPASP